MLDKTTIFAEGLDHPECIAYHSDGTLWAGGEAGQIYRISADGKKVEEVANTKGFILGLAFSPGGQWLLICDSGNKCLWRLDLKTLKLAKLADGGGLHRFNIPNFGCFDNQGNIYVSESGAFREVKGKSPQLTRDMINQSINQTLSRTLLTFFTTFLVVLILYMYGGPGIHAFSFALLIGLIFVT